MLPTPRSVSFGAVCLSLPSLGDKKKALKRRKGGKKAFLRPKNCRGTKKFFFFLREERKEEGRGP